MFEQSGSQVGHAAPPSDRVLSAVRGYRHEHGRSPSLAEIARRALVQRQHVPRYLERLAMAGHLTFDRNAPEPIRLSCPGDALSNLDLEHACEARGWTVVKAAESIAS